MGSEGNIGKPLVNNLLKKNYSVIAVDNKFIKGVKKKDYYFIKSDVTKENNLKNYLIKLEKLEKYMLLLIVFILELNLGAQNLKA